MNKKTRETNLIGIADIVAKQKKRMRKRKDNWSMNWGNPFPLLLTGFFFFFFYKKKDELRWTEMWSNETLEGRKREGEEQWKERESGSQETYYYRTTSSEGHKKAT